jgi:hypothetical protein
LGVDCLPWKPAELSAPTEALRGAGARVAADAAAPQRPHRVRAPEDRGRTDVTIRRREAASARGGAAQRTKSPGCGASRVCTRRARERQPCRTPQPLTPFQSFASFPRQLVGDRPWMAVPLGPKRHPKDAGWHGRTDTTVLWRLAGADAPACVLRFRSPLERSSEPPFSPRPSASPDSS